VAAWLPKGEFKIIRIKVRAAFTYLLILLLLFNSTYTAGVFAQPASSDLKSEVSESRSEVTKHVRLDTPDTDAKGVKLDTSDAGRGLIRISYTSPSQKR
jgi:hypothetical protein